MKKKEFRDVEFVRERRYTFAENEVCMAFYHDEDANSYMEWWLSDGASEFYEWLLENKR